MAISKNVGLIKSYHYYPIVDVYRFRYQNIVRLLQLYKTCVRYLSPKDLLGYGHDGIEPNPMFGIELKSVSAWQVC